ncbi:MAG: polysaccharide biosynthesis/export family protein, partial [Gemmatimonadota bacterium]|nr:polysaccharide biosynthesis/export family protein [Gemmatimonadota bacterium]
MRFSLVTSFHSCALRKLVLGCFVLLLGVTARGGLNAQQPQVQGRVDPDPQLTARLRSEIAKGGLTAEEVRARLRAAGYPEALLDQYLSDSSSRVPSNATRDSLLNAVRALGLVDTTVVDQLRIGRPFPAEPETAARRAIPRGPDSLSIFVRDSLPIFGLDVFRGSSSRFEPTLAGGVGPDYRLGPGDVLAVILTGEVERAYSLDVSREGFVLIPQVGQVYVANLTVSQAQDVLFSRMRQSYAGLSRSPNAATRLFVT